MTIGNLGLAAITQREKGETENYGRPNANWATSTPNNLKGVLNAWLSFQFAIKYFFTRPKVKSGHAQ